MIPLITEQLFKQHSPVTANTDVAEFVPYITIAQELHIADILGERLMTELRNQIEANTLTDANSELIRRIAPALSFYAVYQALPFHWATIVNKGITIRESENSRSVDVKDLAQLRRWLKDDADILKNQLKAFIEKNKADYPLWRQGDSCKNETAFDSGFYFPEKK